MCLATIPLIDPSAQEIGFTGGEPTLLGDDLFRILRAMKSYLPQTAIHILSNGRLFADLEFVKRYADIRHFDMMVGNNRFIPMSRRFTIMWSSQTALLTRRSGEF